MAFQITQQPFSETKLFFPDPEKPIAQKIQRVSTVAKTVFANAATASRTPKFLAEERKAIEEHNGVLWECVGRFSANPGYIYEFTEKPGISQRSEQDRIYPALEIFANQLDFLNVNALPHRRKMHYGSLISITVLDHVNTLGYLVFRDTKLCFFNNKDALFLALPDREALMARWEILVKKFKANGSLLFPKQLKILDSDGIARDDEYVKGSFDNDIILSKKIEFVHDHIHHALATLVFMLNAMPNDYNESKTKRVEVFRRMYQRLISAKTLIDGALQKGKTEITVNGDQILLERLKSNLPKAMGYLSGTVDRLLTSFRKSDRSDEHLKEMVDQAMDDFQLALVNLSYYKYLENRFPTSEYELPIKRIWEAIDVLETAHNAALVK